MSEEFPWSDGNYKGSGVMEAIVVDGDTVTIEGQPDYPMKWKQGDFGDADTEVVEATGQDTYNVENSYDMFGQHCVDHGVVYEDGKKVTFKTSWMGLWSLEWITPEEAERLANDGDPIEAPPSHYELDPDRQGKLVWITGAPGAGKCDAAQMLSKDHGYVFYSGDCFFTCKNPYIPPDAEEPSLAPLQQRKLVGDGLEERKEADRKISKEYEAKLSGGDYCMENIEEAFKVMCANIEEERKRMGGDWVIASMADCRQIRDFIRSQLGDDLLFVVLDVDIEVSMEKIKKRHGDDETIVEMNKAAHTLCEPAEEDEPNTLDIKVTADTGPQDVVDKILEN